MLRRDLVFTRHVPLASYTTLFLSSAEGVMVDGITDLRLPRNGFVVSSKVYFGAFYCPCPSQYGLSCYHVHDACHAAFKRLRVDYLDLYFCHRPDPDSLV